jgi:hypothetical protein
MWEKLIKEAAENSILPQNNLCEIKAKAQDYSKILTS